MRLKNLAIEGWDLLRNSSRYLRGSYSFAGPFIFKRSLEGPRGRMSFFAIPIGPVKNTCWAYGPTKDCFKMWGTA